MATAIQIAAVIAVLYLAFLVYDTHAKMEVLKNQQEAILSKLEGLRAYLYEIDPQFDDERRSSNDLDDERNIFSAMDDMQLLQKKEAEGRRTLNTPF